MALGAGTFSHLDSPSMHFAVGMFCTAVLCIPILMWRPRWWPLIPLMQGLGGMFALTPDFTIALSFYPSLFSWLGDMHAARTALHRDIGNIFFFHAAIDNSGEGNFLRGFVLTAIQYNVWICIFIAHYFFTRRNSNVASMALSPADSRAEEIQHVIASPRVYTSKQSNLSLQLDNARQELAFTQISGRRRSIVPFGNVTSCEVLINSVAIEKSVKGGQISHFREARERLQRTLVALRSEPMQQDEERRIDLSIECEPKSVYLLNFYERVGNQRISPQSLEASIDEIIDWFAAMNEVLGAKRLPDSK